MNCSGFQVSCHNIFQQALVKVSSYYLICVPELLHIHYFMWVNVNSHMSVNAGPSKTPVACAKYLSNQRHWSLTMHEYITHFLHIVHSSFGMFLFVTSWIHYPWPIWQAVHATLWELVVFTGEPTRALSVSFLMKHFTLKTHCRIQYLILGVTNSDMKVKRSEQAEP
jgi:hypothetical protein